MIKNIIAVLITMIRFALIKVLKGNNFSFHGIQRFSPNTTLEIDKKGKMYLGKRVRANTGTKFKIRKNAVLEIGNNVAFNYDCVVVSRNKICIGDGCEIGPGVLIYDHDHDVKNYSLQEGKYVSSPTIIGKNVWIGANAIILRGSVVGNNSVIAAGTIVKGIFPENSLILQKREYTVKEIRNSDIKRY